VRALSCALAVALALSGCSAIFVNKPVGRPPPGAPLACTDSRVAPWIDTYVAAVSLIGTIAIAAKPCQKEEFGCIAKVLVVPLGGLAIGYGISALWGHDAVTTCRELRNPPPAPPPPPTLAGPPPGLDWKPMVAGTAGIEVHSGAAEVAPIIARLPPGTAVSVRPAGVEGWVSVRRPDGRAGYARAW
jgi:hypothetical protein